MLALCSHTVLLLLLLFIGMSAAMRLLTATFQTSVDLYGATSMFVLWCIVLLLSTYAVSAVQLQERCVDVMYGHRKNDVFAVLDFALRFQLPRLQGSCLKHLSQVTRGRLVDKAERIVKVGSRVRCSCVLFSLMTKHLLVLAVSLQNRPQPLESLMSAVLDLLLLLLLLGCLALRKCCRAAVPPASGVHAGKGPAA
jgi:hypothetical protein